MKDEDDTHPEATPDDALRAKARETASATIRETLGLVLILPPKADWNDGQRADWYNTMLASATSLLTSPVLAAMREVDRDATERAAAVAREFIHGDKIASLILGKGVAR